MAPPCALCIPVPVLGAVAVDLAVMGLGGSALLPILEVMRLLSLALTPFAATAALRLALV
jgi:ABC-type transport system involved in cytochrome c biogenesis permease component